MSRKKKGLALWLALFLGVSSLTGCGSGNDNMTQLSQKGADIMSSSDEEQDTDVEPLKTKTQLPEDGIITQAQMETIAGKDEKFYFVGKTDSGIGYKWTYNGSQIQNPVEQKLLVQCTEDGTEEIKKAANNAPYALKVTLEKMNLAAPAKLTLNLKEEWNADKVLYCLEENGKIYQLDTAKISTRESGKKKVKRTTLTFNVTKTGGDFYLIGGSTTGEAADDQADDETKDNTKDNAKGEDTQSKDNKSTGSSSDQADTDRNPTSGQDGSSADNSSDEALRVELNRYSLKVQGLLGRRCPTPMLSGYWKNDPFSPEEDSRLITSSSADGKLLEIPFNPVYRNFDKGLQEITDWIEKRLC